MTTVQSGYRDDTFVAKLRYDEQLTRWTAHAPSVTRIEKVYAARSARIAAGSTGIVGAFTLVVAALVRVGAHRPPPEGSLFLILVTTWPAMMITSGVAYYRAVSAARRAARAPEPTGDLRADLERLAALHPEGRLHALTCARERSSVALPLVALSLLMPLSIHGAIYAFCAIVMGKAGALAGYDYWISISGLVVGHAHLALAFLCRDFARKLASLPREEVASEAARRSRSALWWTVGVSAAPGAVLLLLPPILTAMTGVLFCGPMFRRIARKIIAERAVLGDTSADLVSRPS